jgi:regulator of RNase E activity RraA
MTNPSMPGLGERVSTAYAPIGEKLKAKLLKSAVPTLSAVMFQRGFYTRLFTGVRPINPHITRFCGAAWTIRAIPIREDLRAAISSGELPSRNRLAFDAAPADCVVVCGTGGNAHVAMMGDIMSTSLMTKGVAGVVLDTGVSDAQFIAGMALPVIAAGSSPLSSFASIMVIDYDTPIGSCGVAVFPGDIIVGDANGAICIPRHSADEIAEAAIAQEQLEEFLLPRIKAGAPIDGTYPPNAAVMEDYRAWIRARTTQTP